MNLLIHDNENKTKTTTEARQNLHISGLSLKAALFASSKSVSRAYILKHNRAVTEQTIWRNEWFSK